MTNLLPKVEDFVLHLFKDKLSHVYVYHNFNHTKQVVKSASLLSKKKGLNPHEHKLLLLAAWLHDTGYVESKENHEEHSKTIARSFLEEQKLPQEDIKLIEDIIDVTQLGVEPKTDLEKILKDADFSYFARKDFKEVSELLRQELNLLGSTYSIIEWLNINIKMLTEQHIFYTDYAARNWEPVKQENLIKLIEEKEKNIKKK